MFHTFRRHVLIHIFRCRLNRSIPGNKRWLNTNVPQNGSSVMISGYLESEEICELLVEVETLHYISGLGASEATPSPQASKPGKFGTPKRFVFVLYALIYSNHSISYCRRGYVSGNTSNTARYIGLTFSNSFADCFDQVLRNQLPVHPLLLLQHEHTRRSRRN